MVHVKQAELRGKGKRTSGDEGSRLSAEDEVNSKMSLISSLENLFYKIVSQAANSAAERRAAAPIPSEPSKHLSPWMSTNAGYSVLADDLTQLIRSHRVAAGMISSCLESSQLDGRGGHFWKLFKAYPLLPSRAISIFSKHPSSDP